MTPASRPAHRFPRRPVVPLLIGLAILAAGCSAPADRRPVPGGLLFDAAGIVEEPEKLDGVLADFRERFGVELVIATGRGAEFDDLDRQAARLFSRWRVGACCGGRGLLLLVDADRGAGRLEVAYDLEHVFTDYLCGRIIQQQVRPFWEMDMITVGMLDAVFQIGERSALLALEPAVASARAREDDAFLSGGGGVACPVAFGAGREPKQRLAARERAAYGPGSTPEEVVARFAEALARGVNDNTLEMYTPATQVFFAAEPTRTREYQGYAEVIRSGGPLRVVGDGTHALVQMRPDQPRRIPIFCRRSPAGWQIDWVALFQSHGKSLEGEWVLHRVPVGYEHLVDGVARVQGWATRLPVTVDPAVDIREQVRQAEARLAEEPGSSEGLVRLADLYLACGCWPDALRLYARAAAQAPGDPAYLARLAEAKYYLYFLESAAKTYRRLQAHPAWRDRAARRLEAIRRLSSG